MLLDGCASIKSYPNDLNLNVKNSLITSLDDKFGFKLIKLTNSFSYFDFCKKLLVFFIFSFNLHSFVLISQDV